MWIIKREKEEKKKIYKESCNEQKKRVKWLFKFC